MISYQRISDNSLIALLSEDDQFAFTEIYNRYWKPMLALAGEKLGDIDEAKEVVQQIFVSLWVRRHELEIRNGLSGYIAVSIKYRIINILNRRYRLRQFAEENHAGIDYDDSMEKVMELEELQHRIDNIIAKLPEKCRLVFQLSRNDGISHKKIAQKLNISEKTVEAHIGKALKVIKSGLKSFIFSLL